MDDGSLNFIQINSSDCMMHARGSVPQCSLNLTHRLVVCFSLLPSIVEVLKSLHQFNIIYHIYKDWITYIFTLQHIAYLKN